ncbi:MAG: nitroreductase [Chlorobi bacterium]|nr:nitroreductase [Chlorobiota bacterium]
MSFLDLAKKRYSSRKYKKIPVEDKKLMYILEAARIAPSASNKQPWYFIVIKENENIKKVSSCYHREWLYDASAIIVACANHNISWKRPADGKDHADIDVSIAIDHMTLAATDMGLATCWICNFDVPECCKILNIPEHIEPIAILPVAYPEDKVNENRHTFQRKKIEEIIKWETFN